VLVEPPHVMHSLTSPSVINRTSTRNGAPSASGT